MNHFHYKYILFVIAVFFVVIPTYAYDPNDFLNEYCADGYDMTFNDQHENIFLHSRGYSSDSHYAASIQEHRDK